MQFRIYLLLNILVALLLASCDVHVSSGGSRYVGAGVTFITPMQTSNVTFGPEGIKYESKNLRAETDGKMLRIVFKTPCIPQWRERWLSRTMQT